MKGFEYLEPTSVSEACGLLKRYAGDAKVFAGGSGFTILMKQGLLHPKALVNIKKIKELRGIRHDPTEGLIIGALVTHHEIETSDLLKEKLPVLCELEHDVANIRVRNMATVGGNLASGEPLTDLPCVFISLDSKVKISSSSGDRTLPLEKLFVDYYETVLADDEILTEVVLPPLEPHTGIEYIRFSSSSVVDKPCIGVSVRITVDPKSRACRSVRIGLGCVAPTPMRALRAEKILEGKPLAAQRLEEAAAAAGEECNPLSDLRGSEHYKREMVRVLVRRTVPKAYERALGVQAEP
ncbi:MAG: FAD binding domain-containing protein [Candidatus Binatia bacterium]